jgi:hypothetical protein
LVDYGLTSVGLHVFSPHSGSILQPPPRLEESYVRRPPVRDLLKDKQQGIKKKKKKKKKKTIIIPIVKVYVYFPTD